MKKIIIRVLGVVLAALTVVIPAISVGAGQDKTDAILPDTSPWMGYGGDLQDVLLVALPDADFGGVWMTPGGRIQVGIVDESRSSVRSRQEVLRAAESLKVREGVDIVSVEYPWATLTRTTDAIHQLSLHHIDMTKDTWPIQVEIMTDINRVHVQVPFDEYVTAEHRIVLAEIEEKYRGQVVITVRDTRGENFACNNKFCNALVSFSPSESPAFR